MMIRENERSHSYHIGLCGHVDAGKTTIARMISENIHTAGLDKHPQARERGMSIDLGFTSLKAEVNNKEMLVTLVDAPGHADLINAIVAQANIIDAIILVVAADRGPELQTGEHILVAESYGIKKGIIVINKVDLIDESRKKQILERTKNILAGTVFENSPVVFTSSPPSKASSVEGKDDLLKEIRNLLTEHRPPRDLEGPFRLPIDHAFPIKGRGYVVTGTVVSGQSRIGETNIVYPHGFGVKIRSIQEFGKNVDIAQAGMRVGILIAGENLEANKLTRGTILAKKDSLQLGKEVLIQGKINRFFSHTIPAGSRVHVSINSETLPADFFSLSPILNRGNSSSDSYRISDDDERYSFIPNWNEFRDAAAAVDTPVPKIYSSPISLLRDLLQEKSTAIDSDIDVYMSINGPRRENDFFSLVRVQDAVPCTLGDRVLISRFDLPPTSLRIAGTGRVIAINPFSTEQNRKRAKFVRLKLRKCNLRLPSTSGSGKVILENLSESREGVQKLQGNVIVSPEGVIGKVGESFGTKGSAVLELRQGKTIKSVPKAIFLLISRFESNIKRPA